VRLVDDTRPVYARTPETAEVPGVLVEWSHEGGAWMAHVVYVVLGEQGPVLLDGWVTADRVRPTG
jgi:hypothetical protein